MALSATKAGASQTESRFIGTERRDVRFALGWMLRNCMSPGREPPCQSIGVPQEILAMGAPDFHILRLIEDVPFFQARVLA